MIELLLTIVFCSLYCFGWWIITSDGMILYGVRIWADNNLPEFLYKPLFGCPVCFASVHGGTLFYLLTSDYIHLFPAMVIIAGLNYIMSRLSA